MDIHTARRARNKVLLGSLYRCSITVMPRFRRMSDGPIVTTPGEADRPDVVFSGTAVQRCLSLWNRADEFTTDRPDVLNEWWSQIRVRWSCPPETLQELVARRGRLRVDLQRQPARGSRTRRGWSAVGGEKADDDCGPPAQL